MDARVDGRVLLVTLDRPERRNAVDRAMADALQRVFDDFEKSDELSVAVVRGAGGHLCAGADLRELAGTGSLSLPSRGFAGLCSVPPEKPLIAAVEGFALGGGLEIALACDVMVMGDDATMAFPEVTHGLAALAGGASRLPHRVPRSRAAELVLTGRRFGAAEALSWGLGIAAEHDGAVATALRLAHAVARHPLPGLRESVRLLRSAERGVTPQPEESTARVAALMARLEGGRVTPEREGPALPRSP